MSAIGKGAELKAEGFVVRGNKALKKFSFNKTAKFEEAAEYYQQAATQYKMAKNYEQSANYFYKAAELMVKAKNQLEAATYYGNAADMYKKDNLPDKAITLYEIVIEQHMEANRHSTAARMYKTIAELAEKSMDLQKAVTAYASAADLYQMENSNTTANQLLLEVARIKADLEDYAGAITIYEDVAREAIDSKLTHWSCKDYYFKAMLCRMSKEAIDEFPDFGPCEEALAGYMDMYPAFENSRECKFVDKLIQSFKDNDITGWADAVFEWDTITKLDDWSTTRLFEVKKVMKEQARGAEEDEDDLL